MGIGEFLTCYLFIYILTFSKTYQVRIKKLDTNFKEVSGKNKLGETRNVGKIFWVTKFYEKHY